MRVNCWISSAKSQVCELGGEACECQLMFEIGKQGVQHTGTKTPLSVMSANWTSSCGFSFSVFAPTMAALRNSLSASTGSNATDLLKKLRIGMLHRRISKDYRSGVKLKYISQGRKGVYINWEMQMIKGGRRR